MEFLFVISLICAIVFYSQRNNQMAEVKKREQTIEKLKLEHQIQAKELMVQLELKNKEVESLSAFKEIRDLTVEADRIKNQAEKAMRDAQTEANRILSEANNQAGATVGAANAEAERIRRDANLDAKTKREKVESLLNSATREASQIIIDANQKAVKIAGDAYEALRNADNLKEIARAMENVIQGYGDKYLKPTFSLLDELAEAYGFDEAGQQLKVARERTKLMVENDQAASCDYVERNRKDTAVRFVVDAFNGKVDSILSRSKADNYGTLEQQIRDAYSLVNFNGAAFRNAVINPQYLEARLTELKWVVAVFAVREKEKEEQRRIREQMREEEKARREIERALRDAAKEEEAIQKAMEKVQAHVEKASEEQKAKFMAQLSELQEKLRAAEEKNQRAMSMAQQTKAGHVYVISNIGSFGENVYKVGMTRRLEPLDRVRELGDASVPFAFDVHAMIWSDDAPGLENALHKHFLKAQVNKVNPRKEFFRLTIDNLRKHTESLGIETVWTMSSIAADYRETLAIEAKLAENGVLAEEWVHSQLKYDAQEELASELIEDVEA